MKNKEQIIRKIKNLMEQEPRTVSEVYQLIGKEENISRSQVNTRMDNLAMTSKFSMKKPGGEKGTKIYYLKKRKGEEGTRGE